MIRVSRCAWCSSQYGSFSVLMNHSGSCFFTDLVKSMMSLDLVYLGVFAILTAFQRSSWSMFMVDVYMVDVYMVESAFMVGPTTRDVDPPRESKYRYSLIRQILAPHPKCSHRQNYNNFSGSVLSVIILHKFDRSLVDSTFDIFAYTCYYSL